MEKFLRYNIQIAKDQNKEDNHGTFVIKPLERGFGTTIGNSIRRVMLSSLIGHSIFAIKIPNITHEFQPVKGIKEDLTQIILNLKKLVINIDQDVFGEEEQKETKLEKWPVLKLDVSKPGAIKASDIELPVGFDILNKDLTIATLEKNATFKMEIFAKTGRGFNSSNENKELVNSINYIATDSNFCPILKVSYKVTEIKTTKKDLNDSLELEVATNGSLSAAEAVALAAKILIEHYKPIVTDLHEHYNDLKIINEDFTYSSGKSSLAISIDELELSVRSYNCLKRAGIHTITQLTDKTKQEIEKIRNLGKKSFKEIIKKIQERKLKLKDEPTIEA